ncbi:hypothetical protein Ddc_18023 [Ditylenchus destructor]|nr:hypothetical protein Ddc_18023 [Ditylenchus destructor]
MKRRRATPVLGQFRTDLIPNYSQKNLGSIFREKDAVANIGAIKVGIGAVYDLATPNDKIITIEGGQIVDVKLAEKRGVLIELSKETVMSLMIKILPQELEMSK